LPPNHVAAKLRIVIEQQEFVNSGVRPCFPHLLRDPKGIGIARHIETQNLSSLVADHKEAIKNAKRNRRHCEEIHRGNGLAMVPQKRQPALGWIGRSRRWSKPT
jgi:phosphoketolase